jgi:hypothetical protein
MTTLSNAITDNVFCGFTIVLSSFAGRILVKVIPNDKEIDTNPDGNSQVLPCDHATDENIEKAIRFLALRYIVPETPKPSYNE